MIITPTVHGGDPQPPCNKERSWSAVGYERTFGWAVI